jgi:hypothetical protein
VSAGPSVPATIWCGPSLMLLLEIRAVHLAAKSARPWLQERRPKRFCNSSFSLGGVTWYSRDLGASSLRDLFCRSDVQLNLHLAPTSPLTRTPPIEIESTSLGCSVGRSHYLRRSWSGTSTVGVAGAVRTIVDRCRCCGAARASSASPGSGVSSHLGFRGLCSSSGARSLGHHSCSSSSPKRRGGFRKPEVVARTFVLA